MGVNGANVPGYEIYFAPDARKVEGIYYSDQPSLRYGHLVSGIVLDFSGGVDLAIDEIPHDVRLSAGLEDRGW